MDRLLERLRPACWPWSVKGYMLASALVPLCTWAVSKPKFYAPVGVFAAGYLAAALLFVVTRNDWIRFVISAFHFLMSGMTLFAIVFILPDRNPDALFPLRAVLIFGATLITTALLWHPDTGRWVMRR